MRKRYVPVGRKPLIRLRTFTGHLLAKMLKVTLRGSVLAEHLPEFRFLQDQFPQGCTQDVASIITRREPPTAALPDTHGLALDKTLLVIMSISGRCLWNRILALPDGDHKILYKSLVKGVLDSMIDMVTVHTTELYQDQTTTHFRIAPKNREQCAQKVFKSLRWTNTFQCSEEEMLQLGFLPFLKEEYTAGLPNVPDIDWELSQMDREELTNSLVPVDPTKQYRQYQWREASMYRWLYAELARKKHNVKLAEELGKLVKASVLHGEAEADSEAFHSPSDVD